MAWTGSDVEHCSDDSEAPEFYARDARDIVAEEAAADVKLQERIERGKGNDGVYES